MGDVAWGRWGRKSLEASLGLAAGAGVGQRAQTGWSGVSKSTGVGCVL